MTNQQQDNQKEGKLSSWQKISIGIFILVFCAAGFFIICGIYTFYTNRTKTNESTKIDTIEIVPSFTHENSLGDLGDYMGGVAGVMGCFISIIGLYYVYQTFQQQKKQIEDQKAQIEKQDEELKAQIEKQDKELKEQNRIQKEHNDAIVEAIGSITGSQATLAKKLHSLAGSNWKLANHTKDIENHNKDTAFHIASLSKVALTKLNYDIYNSLYEEWKSIEFPKLEEVEENIEETAIRKEKENIQKIWRAQCQYFAKFWALCKFIQSNFTKQEIETKATFHTLINGLSEEAKYIIFQNLLHSKEIEIENAKIAREYVFFKPKDNLVMCLYENNEMERRFNQKKKYRIGRMSLISHGGNETDDWKTYQDLANS